MKRTIVLVALAALALSACDHNLNDIKDCVAGRRRPVPLDEAVSIVKAAGFEVRKQAAEAPKPVEMAPPRQFALLCDATVRGQRISESLSVDLDARTVNGVRAQVSPTELRWSTPYRNPGNGVASGEVHTLNRLNGDYRFYVEGAMYAEPPPTYRCQMAPRPVF